MRHAIALLLLAVVFCFMALPTAPAQGVRDLPDLPGPFHAYNVTGPFANKYHCLITEHDLDPGVILFVRCVEGSLDEKKNDLHVELTAPMKDLLGKLDNLAEKNPTVRLEVYVVCYGDAALPNVVFQDDERELLAAELKKMSEDMMLKHVFLALGSRDLPEEDKESRDDKLKKAQPLRKQYKIEDNSEVTVVLYKRFRVYGRHDLTKDAFTEAKVAEIVGEVKTKFGAKRE